MKNDTEFLETLIYLENLPVPADLTGWLRRKLTQELPTIVAIATTYQNRGTTLVALATTGHAAAIKCLLRHGNRVMFEGSWLEVTQGILATVPIVRATLDLLDTLAAARPLALSNPAYPETQSYYFNTIIYLIEERFQDSHDAYTELATTAFHALADFLEQLPYRHPQPPVYNQWRGSVLKAMRKATW